MSRVLFCSALLAAVAASATIADDAPQKQPKTGQGPLIPRSTDPKAGPYYPAFQAKPQRAQPQSPPAKRLVYRVKHVPAVDLAKTVNEFLRTEEAAQPGRSAGRRVVIVPEPITNSLLVSAPAEELDQLAEIISQLDAPPAMVSIQVLIAEVTLDDGLVESGGALFGRMSGEDVESLIAELKKHGQFKMLARPAVTTLDNQSAFVQVGQREPRITATAMTPRGKANSVTLEDTGLTLGVTPRINADGLVTMEIDVDESHLGPAEEGTVISSLPGGEEVRAPQVQSSKLQTTVSAASGQTVVLGGLVSRQEAPSARWQGTLVFLTPYLLNPKHSD